MNLVMPMAGRGSRFAGTSANMPKPLIEVAGEPMLAWAWRSLHGLPISHAIFVALAEHEHQFGVTSLARDLAGPKAEVILLDDVTEGQVCTVLTARHLIDDDEDLLIASADTYVVSLLREDIAQQPSNCRGLISVARMPGDRWSFALADTDGRVIRVAEKDRISDLASTGLYYFRSGAEFVRLADEMIHDQEKTKGEYYVMPVYGRYLSRGLEVRVSVAEQMWDMGVPEALATFEQWLAGKTGGTSSA